MSLGVRFETRLNKHTKQFEQIPVEDTFIYIPVIPTELLLKTPRYSSVC